MEKMTSSEFQDRNLEQTQSSSIKNQLVKVGVWYTVCNFLFKTVTFLATPVFSRLLSKEEMGNFTNFNSWVLILSVLTALDLQQSIILTKVENKEDMDCYIFSILSLTTITTSIFLILVILFPTFFVNLFGIELKYIYIMIAYLLFTPAYQMYITKQRAYYKYKGFVAVTGIVIVSSVLLSIVLVFLLENKLTGRLVGNYLPYILVGAALYLILVLRGRRIKVKYWKYALTLCLPLVPHVLSMNLLSSSDKIIITKLCGTELTAIYGIAYTVYNIVVVFFDSMNKAWAPWLIENLHREKYQDIRKISRSYILIFQLLIFGVLLLTPEIVLILGGKQYAGAEYCIAPLIASCVFQFIYTMYVNIEFYKKKTMMVSVATMTAMGINILLNYLLIPLDLEHGHIIASYTTLIGYILLFVMHFLLVKRLNMTKIYDTKYIFIMLLLTLVVSLAMNLLYQLPIVRYLLLALFLIAALIIGWRYKATILSFFHARKSS